MQVRGASRLRGGTGLGGPLAANGRGSDWDGTGAGEAGTDVPASSVSGPWEVRRKADRRLRQRNAVVNASAWAIIALRPIRLALKLSKLWNALE